MSEYNIDQITPSKYGDGDRWRIRIGEDWYDLYADADSVPQAPCTLALEWKQSKSGKEYATIPGARRAPQARSQSAPPRTSGSAPRTPPGPSPSAGPREYDPTRDQWIVVSTIIGHWIDTHPDLRLADLNDLAAHAATAAAKVRYVLTGGAAVQAARAAVEAAPDPAPRRPAPKPAQAELGDPDDPRNTGPDFDDDIPF